MEGSLATQRGGLRSARVARLSPRPRENWPYLDDPAPVRVVRLCERRPCSPPSTRVWMRHWTSGCCSSPARTRWGRMVRTRRLEALSASVESLFPTPILWLGRQEPSQSFLSSRMLWHRHLSPPILPCPPPGRPRDDDSIFIAISAHRVRSCHHTLRRAFSHADQPSRVVVGVVELLCSAECSRATGWAESRRLEAQEQPDEGCSESFCKGEGAEHCAAGRVRALRLSEVKRVSGGGGCEGCSTGAGGFVRALLLQVPRLASVERRDFLHAD